MSKKLQLSIPTPCHENWEAMTLVEKGKFCGSCQKKVVDFSNMSDRQVAEFFKKPSTGSVCGRFMSDQLERDIEIPRKRIPWLKYFFQFVIPAFLVSIKASAEKTQGKIKVVNVAVKPPEINTLRVRGLMILPADTTFKSTRITLGTVTKQICTKPLMGDTIISPVNKPVENLKGEISIITNDQRNRTISGTVTNEIGEPIPGAIISIKGTQIRTFSDNNGQFLIHAKTGDNLVISGAGFELTEAVIGESNSISLSVNRMYLGEITVGIIVHREKPKKEIQNVPLLKQTITDTVSKSFKIFPNPVQSGSNLNIEWKQTEEGYYTLQLLNQSGQTVHQKEIWIDAEARVLQIDIPPVATGSYFLTLTNKKSGKRFTEKIIVK